MKLLASTVAAIILATACSSGDGTEPQAGTSPSPPATIATSAPVPSPTPTPTPTPTGKPPGCSYVVEPGLIRATATASSHVWVVNGATSFACDNGRRVGVRVQSGRVTLSLSAAKVTISPGKAVTFAGYQITLTSMRRNTAKLDVTRPR